MWSVRHPSRPAMAAVALACAAAAFWFTWSRREAPAWPAAVLPRGNVLLVTIDTLRADRVSEATMPGLVRLARESRNFPTTYSHAPLTLPAHASILTGLLPPSHGARGNGAFRLDRSHLTLADRLSAAGYRTGAFVGSFVLDRRFGLAQGFDRYDGVDDDRAFASDFTFVQRRAPDVLARAAPWILDAVDPARPWFAWVHLFDPHAPYDAPGASGPVPYDDEVRYVDRALTGFLDRLRQRGALARTLVIITADHGESLGEHGESTHGLFAYDATMRVPLVVGGPGLEAGDHTEPAAHIDLVPTVLDALGLPADPALPGRSLRLRTAQPGGGKPSFYLEAMDGWLTAGAAPVTALVRDGWKFIDVPLPELYDLRTDPGETRNQFAANPEQVRSLGQALHAFTLDTAAGLAQGMAGPRDPDAERRLRSLGYASGGPRSTGLPPTEADDPKRVLPLYERFLEQLAGGVRDVAGLRALFEARPSFEAARLVAASVLIETGRAVEAVGVLEPATSTPGASLALRERLGAALLAAGRTEQAVVALESAITDPAASADAWNALGVARATLGRHDAALEAFDRAVGLAPDAVRLQFNRALALVQAQEPAAALIALTALVGSHPDFADGWRALATLRHGQGNRVGAVEAWQRVVALAPSDTDTLFNLAVTLRDLGRLDEARAAATRFAAAAPRPAYDREISILSSLITSR